ncbi:MAG: hypothetical protein IH939_17240 [Acidobacteria bacterium]|nr:hypothetical protein [Acidobacteriota bacterium]
MQHYSFSDVLKFTGATRNQLVRWTDIRVIEAAQGSGLGTGHRRSFSLMNLAEVLVAKELAAFRVATPKLRELLVDVPAFVKARVARVWLDADGSIRAYGDGGDPTDVQPQYPVLLMIGMRAIVEQLEAKTGETFPKGSSTNLAEFVAAIQRRQLRRIESKKRKG